MQHEAYALAKTCSVCKQEKPLDDFPKDSSRKDGRMCRCRDCDNARCASYYKRAPFKVQTINVRGLNLGDEAAFNGPACTYCLSPIPPGERGSVGKRGRALFCSSGCSRAHDAERKIAKPIAIRSCVECGRTFYTLSGTRYRVVCSAKCRDDRKRTSARARYDQARERAKRDKRMRALRLENSDVTPAHIRQLYRSTKRCPLCAVELTAMPRLPHSREVDHIIPINAGGTHTIGNLRVICRACNGARPSDGSDLDMHQPTLWAVAPKAA
jgi:hypothetical protein